MNLNVHIKDEIFSAINQIAKSDDISKKDIVNLALEEWLKIYQRKQCIDIVKNMEVIKDFDDFDNIRSEMNKTQIEGNI